MSQRARVPPLQPFSCPAAGISASPLYPPLRSFASATRYNKTGCNFFLRETRGSDIHRTPSLFFFCEKGKMLSYVKLRHVRMFVAGSWRGRKWLKYDGKEEREGRYWEGKNKHGRKGRKHRSQLKKIIKGRKDCGEPGLSPTFQRDICKNEGKVHRRRKLSKLELEEIECVRLHPAKILINQGLIYEQLTKNLSREVGSGMGLSFLFPSPLRDRPVNESREDPPPGKLERN